MTKRLKEFPGFFGSSPPPPLPRSPGESLNPLNPLKNHHWKGDLYLAGNLVLLSFREKFEFRTHYLSFLEHEELLSPFVEKFGETLKRSLGQKRASQLQEEE